MIAEVPAQPPEALLTHMFVLEVLRACRHTELAGADLAIAASQHDDERTWFAVQALLVAAAHVSKLLWPAPGSARDQPRATRLRALLGVDETSPLNAVDMRNHFEHFDERLERWAAHPGPKALGDRLIGPRQAVTTVGPITYYRTFDPARLVVSFEDEEYPLHPVIAAARDLAARAARFTLPVVCQALDPDPGSPTSA